MSFVKSKGERNQMPNINYFQAFLDSTVLIQATVVAYKDPNDPTDEKAVADAMAKMLVNLGVPAQNTPEIGVVFGHAVVAAGGADTAPADILNDFNNELAKHHIVLPQIASMFLMVAITQAITALRGLITGKK
jgi:hypothetical protein